MKNYLFVYGSLREGFFNFDKYLDGKVVSNKLGKIPSGTLYHMPNKGYPALIKSPNQGEILGEVIEVKDFDTLIKDLDKMEGFISENNPNNEYNRELLEITLIDSNEKVYAYTYVYNMNDKDIFDKHAVHITHGDWKKFMLSKDSHHN